MVRTFTKKWNVRSGFKITGFKNQLAEVGEKVGAEEVKIAYTMAMEVTKTANKTTEIIKEMDLPNVTTKTHKKAIMVIIMDF